MRALCYLPSLLKEGKSGREGWFEQETGGMAAAHAVCCSP